MANQHAKRKDDLYMYIERAPLLGKVEFATNGKNVVQILMAMGFVIWAFWHDTKQDRLQHSQEITTCVLTLNEDERREFRKSGRYCNPLEWSATPAAQSNVDTGKK